MSDLPSLEEVKQAAERLAGVAVHTPLVPLHSFDGVCGILLKPEIHQPVTSFKIRGVYNAVAKLSEETRSQGLSTVSAGNTAQALAWVGRRFGVSSRSIMPDTAPPTKIEAVRRYGGEPVLVPTEEVFRFLKERLWEQEPYAFIHPWIDRNVWIGHGTIGLEMVADCPEVETVYIPVGGGGLITGVGSVLKALKPSVHVVAVEPVGCPAVHESLKLGRPASVACETICDGVAVPYVTDEVFPHLKRIVDESVLVSEEAVKETVKRLALGNRLIVEPSGALSVAAALSVAGALDVDAVGSMTRPTRGGRTICLLTGGSIDVAKLIEILSD